MPLTPILRLLFVSGVVGFACATAGYIVGRHISVASLPRDAASDASPRPSARDAADRISSPSPFSPSAADSAASAPTAPDVSQSSAESAWRAFLAAPATPATEEAALSALRALAATDHARALQLAQSAPTPRQRDAFLRAVLHGWAATDPMQAAAWTLAHIRVGERRLAVEALVAGASARPEDAVRAVALLCSSDPQSTSDYGQALVHEFARTGRFELAGRFAASGPSEYRAAWLSTAFFAWGQYQPSGAVAAAARIADPTARTEALQGVVAGWAATDPAALVAYAQKLPLGETRLSALRDGLQQWVTLDPAAAADWMDAFDPSPDLDAGAAAVATAPALVAKKPDVAASWAESIVDPELRANTLLDLIRLWGATDTAAARSYAATSPALRPETRQLALASLQPAP